MEILKVAFKPLQTDKLAGSVSTIGGAIRSEAPAEVTTLPHAPETTTLKLYPSNEILAPDTVSVDAATPVKVPPLKFWLFVKFDQIPVEVLICHRKTGFVAVTPTLNNAVLPPHTVLPTGADVIVVFGFIDTWMEGVNAFAQAPLETLLR